MKLAEVFARPMVALLLGLGLVASGVTGAAQAKGPIAHAPIICKMGGGASVDGTGICGRRDQNTGGPAIDWDASMYKYYDDISPYAPFADPLKFPKSDGGLNCDLEEDGTLRCWRYIPSTTTPGRDNCSLSEVRNPSSYACRGSVVEAILEKDEATAPGGSNLCTPETIYYGKGANGQARYYSEAMQCYDGSGIPTVPTVVWYKNDGKGKNHAGTVLGTTRGYLKAESPAGSEIENANSVAVTSTITPSSVTGADKRADYAVSVRAATSGSTLVRLHVSGLGAATEDSVPSDWVRLSSLSGEYISYLIPFLNPGEIASAQLHFTVTSLKQGSVLADANGTTASSTVDVRPDAPVCTTPGTKEGKAVALVGSQATLLRGIHCTTQASTTLKAWTGADRGAGTFSVISDEISYVPASDTFTGDDTIFVYAANAAGVASLPTAVHVRVGGPAVSADDDQTIGADTPLVLDAAHGLVANDLFPSGRDGWKVSVETTPARGTVDVAADGSLRFEPQRAFTGDASFTYHLTGPLGETSESSTVTIHVVSDEPPAAPVGQSYTYVLAPSQGSSSQFQLTSGRLPDGIKIDKRTGTISGTPTKVGTYHFVVMIAGQSGSGLRTIDMSVVDPTASGDE